MKDSSFSQPSTGACNTSRQAELGSPDNPHDYRNPYWGHDYVWHPDEGGLTGEIMGWGYGIEKWDYILLGKNGGDGSRYQFTSVRYYSDPRDMFTGRLRFKPRSPQMKARLGLSPK